MSKLYIMMDVESDGPYPGKSGYSMTEFGAIVVEPSLNRSFYGQCRPISDRWIPEALAVSGRTREETLGFPDPKTTMTGFSKWLKSLGGHPVFVSDNAVYDGMFIFWYLHQFTGECPLGHSGRNFEDIYRGMKGSMKNPGKELKRFKKTRHTHHPLDDARGNAEALLKMFEMGLRP